MFSKDFCAAELLSALTGTAYSARDISIVTLEDAFFMGMTDDLAVMAAAGSWCSSSNSQRSTPTCPSGC
jgi:hypothetical protein